jgi:8-oxo-dGTP pyrophosphatase MutT (NUDIX family)
MSEPTAADRAFRALSDAVDRSRTRTALDGVDPDVPVAATVLILRDGAAGIEVLMMKRPDRGSFAGAWVFPGGKLEEVDRDGDVGDELAAARRAGARETFEEIGLVVDAERLVPLSRWDPPPGLALRIRTWFFVAERPGGDLVLAPDEVVAADWVRASHMLARHGRGELTLYPPTWVTLAELVEHRDVASAVHAARIGGLHRFETVARRGAAGPVMLWEDDAAYEDETAAGSARHRLEIGALPWVYFRQS